MREETSPDSSERNRRPRPSDETVRRLSNPAGRLIEDDGLNLCCQTQSPEGISKIVDRNGETRRESSLRIDDMRVRGPSAVVFQWALETATRPDAELSAIPPGRPSCRLLVRPVPNGALAD